MYPIRLLGSISGVLLSPGSAMGSSALVATVGVLAGHVALFMPCRLSLIPGVKEDYLRILIGVLANCFNLPAL